MEELQYQGRWFLVTGASSGLGRELARQLAVEHGANVVLVARRAERLEELAREIRAHGAQAVTVAADLARPSAAEEILAAATAGRTLHGFISCAGTYWYGRAQDIPPGTEAEMIQVNALSPIALIRGLLPRFEAQGAGALLAITSIAGLLPAPFQSLYAGTKAMVQTFVQNLYHELGGPSARIIVSVCSPGGVQTEMLSSSPVYSRVQASRLFQASTLSPEAVAREALAGWRRRSYLIVPGRVNQTLWLASKLLPRRLLGEQNVKLYRPEESSSGRRGTE